MKKRLLAVVMVMALMCLTLTGCGAKLAPADQTISALFDLYAKENAAPMKDLLGFASEEDVNTAFFAEDVNVDLVDDLKAELESAGVEMSDEDIQELSDTMYEMMNKTSCTAEITSEEGDVTVVTLKINGYSYEEMGNIIMEAADTMMNSITEEDMVAISEGNMEVFNTYMQQYVKDFMSGLAAMELVAEPVEVTVECEKLLVDVSGKETAAWLPSDMDAFASDVDAALFQE